MKILVDAFSSAGDEFSIECRARRPRNRLGDAVVIRLTLAFGLLLGHEAFDLGSTRVSLFSVGKHLRRAGVLDLAVPIALGVARLTCQVSGR